MLVKLSGDKYIESNHITGIERAISEVYDWFVYTIDGHMWGLKEAQFDELMDCLPTPIESDRKRSK